MVSMGYSFMPRSHWIETEYGKLYSLADTRENHTGVLAVSNYLGSSLVAGILTFVLSSLYGFNYAKTKHLFSFHNITYI